MDQQQYSPRNIHATIWAYATCGYCHRDLLVGLETLVINNIDTLVSHTLCNVAW
jgi:hypothetical protein